MALTFGCACMRQVVLRLCASGSQLTTPGVLGHAVGALMKGSPPATPAVQAHASTVWAALVDAALK